jgi:hypothetical protein
MSWFSSFLSTAESDVIKTITAIKSEATVAIADINAALKWIADNAGTITTDIQEVLGLVQVVGIANPSVEAAVTAANAAVGALNAYAAAYKSGTGTPAAVIAGYSAFKQAQAAAASATAIAVQASVTPTPAPAPAPAPAAHP